MRPVRASEIGSYLFCARAWWYQRQGFESASQSDMTTGTDLHRSHGRQVILSGLTRVIAFVLLLLALLLVTAYCTKQLF